MQAGKLDRVIEVQSLVTTVDEYGTPDKSWSTLATMRAQKLENDTSNREGGHTVTDTSIAFRIYWLDNLTLDHRVIYEGQPFKIARLKEIGRRVGLDVVCERVGLS